ncbi:MAG: nucleotide-binding protein [Peptococcaceae bacterium]|nr:nucleotide-binding protein [Peptococcaceae bacterium]
MHYHIRITRKSNPTRDEVRLDLDKETVLGRFIEPYELGAPIIINGRAIENNDIDRIRVSCSQHDSSSLIRRIEAEHAKSSVGVIGLSKEWEVADRANDVTDEFIKGAPGYRKRENNVAKLEQSGGQRVFIVHGHDHALLNELVAFLGQLGIQPVVLRRQPDEGLTVIEKFEKHAAESGYVFVLLTPDDIAFPASELDKPEGERVLKARARQNVILEAGYFIGTLGRSRVCLLYKEGVELPSDMAGLLYKPASASIENIGYEIIRELRAAGVVIRL